MNKIALAAALMALAAVTTEAKFKINAHKLTKGIKKATKIANTAQQIGLLDEDEADWEFNAGISGQGGQKPNYNVGISGKWEDEEEQKFKLGKTLKTVTKVAVIASEAGLLEEDGEEEQKFKLGKALKKTAKVLVKANELGLLEEEALETQGLKKTLKKAVKVAVVATELGLLDDEEILEEEQKFKLGKALKKVAKVAVIASEVGLLDEEQEQKIKIGKALKKAVKVAVTAQQLGLLDEADWEFNAGISGQGGQKPNYNVGISGKWDEEQGFGTKLNNALNTIDHAVNTAHSLGLMDDEEQKIKIGKALNKVAKVAVKANELGLLEEDEQQTIGEKVNNILDKIESIIGTIGRVKEIVNAIKNLEEDEGFVGNDNVYVNRPRMGSNSGVWDEEQKFKLGKTLNTAVKVATTAQQLGLLEEADWGFNAGISGQVGQRPNYNVGISAKWDEEEEQKFKLGKALKKAAHVAVKANELGLLEEADWQFNAGLSGQVGQRPNYNVGISGKWDEEQGFGTKLNNALNTIDHAVNTAHSLGLMDEEEQKIKIGRALKKVAKVAVKANELGLLDEDEQQGLGKKINKILDKVDKVTTTAHRIQDTVNSIKSLEEDNGFLLGGEGSTWVKHQIPSDWLR